MSTAKNMTQQLGNWAQAYQAVVAELDDRTGERLRSDPEHVRNARVAAVVAAMLVSSGIRPVPIAYGDMEEGGDGDPAL